LSSYVFSTAEISELTGFSIRQLNYWAGQKLIIPSVKTANGSGSTKLYGLDNLLELRFVRRLKDNQWSTQKIRRAIETLRDVMNDPNPLRRAVIISNKELIIAICKTKEGERITLDALNQGGQQVMGITIEMLLEETQQLAVFFDKQKTVEEAKV
jgi:DNA-binding transcriptional MerR regulator